MNRIIFIFLIFTAVSGYSNHGYDSMYANCVSHSKALYIKQYETIVDVVICQWNFGFKKDIVHFENAETAHFTSLFRTGIISAQSIVKSYFKNYPEDNITGRSSALCSALIQRARYVLNIYSIKFIPQNSNTYPMLEIRTTINCNIGGPYIFDVWLEKGVKSIEEIKKVKCYRFSGVQF